MPLAERVSTAAAGESGSDDERLASLADACTDRPDRDVCLRAADEYRRALAHHESVGDQPQQAEILQQLGRLHRKYLEDRRAALRYYGAARELYAQLGDRRSESVVLNNLGRLHFQLGEMKLAVEHWQQALPLKREIGDAAGEAATLGNLGLACRYRGDFQAALAYYDRTIGVLESDDDHDDHDDRDTRVELGRAYNNRGRFYDSLGRPDRALADLRTARDLGRQTGDPALQAMALTAIGRIQLAAGEAAAALASLQAAAGLRQAAGSDRGIAVTARGLGDVYESLGRWHEARSAYATARRIFERQDSPRDLARAHGSLGRLALASGKAMEAERHYRRAGELFRELADPEGIVLSLSGLARALRAKGDVESAREQVSGALARIEELRRRAATPDLRRSFLARYQDDVGLLVDLLMELHRHAPDAGHDRQAFEVHERSRARALFDQIESPRQVVPGDGVSPADDEIVAATQMVELLSRQHRTLRERDGPAERLQELEAKLDEALRELWSLRGASAMGRPRADPGPVLGVADIRRQLLDDDSTLLAYRLGPERSFLWLLTRSSFESFELPPGDDIAAEVLRAHRLLRSSHLREARVATRKALEALSNRLLAPAAASLTGDRLLIVADGALHYLPFSALPAPTAFTDRVAPRDSLPLVRRRQIVMLPSASSVAALRRRSAGRSWQHDVAVMAGGSRFATREAELIRASGDEAGRNVALVSAPRGVGGSGGSGVVSYRVLHLAAHGEIDAARPELSRLVFDQAAHLEGRPSRMLYADQIASLDLPVELVVLSACDTALGPVVPGEGFIGLPQAFFQAGASSVLVSLWKVDDRATAELMELLYADLLRAGESPAAALQRAQNSLRTSPGRSAPYFWAGFVLLGDWRWN